MSGDIPKRGYSQWEMPCYNAQMQLSSCLLLFKQNFTHNEIKISKLSRIFLDTLNIILGPVESVIHSYDHRFLFLRKGLL